ncbi:ABC transporter substrate-binding protein [uncultured Aeromicrobium sp.]|uniref:ABC transporter substrate-binding protein n=1 Tax=uncultured Aeromicrobium sp. TaxID=337820 RepID=UPI0025F41C5B|nr:ABC transporter substrate-binding protein [uncultured Aeromicrobium sp.]
MDRRSFLGAAGLVVVSTAGGSLLAACAPGGNQGSNGQEGGGSGSATNLTFMTPFQHIMAYADVYVAIQQGFFEDEGLRVEAVGGTGTATSVTQVVAGQAQIGKAASIVTCPLIADEGADIITVALGDQRSQYSVASSVDAPLTHPEQWQGKTIGVISQGGATELLLDAMSVAVGLDPSAVNKVVTGADVSSLEFLNRGEVDGFITFMGSETALRHLGVELNYLNTDEFAPMPSDAYIVKKSALESQGEEIASFLRACRRGFEFMDDPANQQAVLEAVGQFNPTEVSDEDLALLKLEAQLELCRPASGDFLSMDLGAWQSAVDLMRRAGIVEDTSRPVTDFATTQILEAL